MARGPFFPWLKPDHKQKLVKPSVSVASYIVDQWRKLAYVGVAFGVAGLTFGGLAGAWAFAKERMPSYTITPLIQPNGWTVKTYITDGNEPLDDRIVCSVLMQTIMNLRSVSGSASALKSTLEMATNSFADQSAIRLRRELSAADWYKPLINQRQTREVMWREMNCYRVVGNDNRYNIEWRERLHNSFGPMSGSERPKALSVAITRLENVPDRDRIANFNPHGIFINDYTGTLD